MNRPYHRNLISGMGRMIERVNFSPREMISNGRVHVGFRAYDRLLKRRLERKSGGDGRGIGAAGAVCFHSLHEGRAKTSGSPIMSQEIDRFIAC